MGQLVEDRKNRKYMRIGRKIGNVVVIMQAISVVLAVATCVIMYSAQIKEMQKNICTSGTNLLEYELDWLAEEEDINQALDELKAHMGCEFTIFEGDTRAYSTVTQNGERVVGTKLDSNLCDMVLNKCQSYVCEANILG